MSGVIETYRDGNTFEYWCEVCGLPFAQSYDFHVQEYHDGQSVPTSGYVHE